MHKFYPSIFGRLFFFVLALLPAFIFVYICFINFYDYGILIAADGIVTSAVLTLMILFSFVVLIGLGALHFLSLAISPQPSVVVDEDGISFRKIGTNGYEHVSWRGVRFGKTKGLSKYLYRHILVPKQVVLNNNQNIIFKYILWIFKKIYQLITFRFATSLRRSPFNKDNFQRLRIYGFSIGNKFSELDKVLDEKIAAYGARSNKYQPIKEVNYTGAVVRVAAADYLNQIWKIILKTTIGIVFIFPFVSISLGAFAYNSNSKNDPLIKQTKALRTLALSGHADSQNKFGWRLSNGVGLPKSQARAERWYRLAAKQGHAKAQYNVGISYKCTRKKKSSCKKAAKWLRKAANSGLDVAQARLAYQYYKGWGISKSYVRAFDLFSKAAEKNHGYSLYFLGYMYEKGRGVEQSKSRAVFYYEAAIKNGYPKAQKAIDRITS